ncbi:MAG: tRNA pseudouridine(38-40) synthase TruA [Candidatus Marinimicrobia bacterium]|nr:tRNA pseudouridine(38-40) synthase TruA [Candidatus Neomarinimicrobiota bacterium]
MGALNYKLLIEYDGSAFHGWQAQKSHRTVQQVLERACATLVNRRRVVVNGAGRTDAGVHARGQVASVQLDTGIPVDRLADALNNLLPEDIRVFSVERVTDEFHARFSAIRRRYSYTLSRRRPIIGRQYIWFVKYDFDHNLLEQCATLVRGEHDFTGFSKFNPEIDTTVCNIGTSYWELGESQLIYHIAGNRFLHHMVRFLAGTMIEVARGRFTVTQFKDQLAGVESALSVYCAPAAGLVLEEVNYDGDS